MVDAELLSPLGFAPPFVTELAADLQTQVLLCSSKEYTIILKADNIARIHMPSRGDSSKPIECWSAHLEIPIPRYIYPMSS